MKPTPTKKSWWPFGIVSVFVMFISWLATFIGIAVTNSMDLVSTDYYEQEMKFQEQIDRVNRTTATTGMAIKFDPAKNEISFQLPDEHVGETVTGELKLYRPDNARLDRIVGLETSTLGQQTLALDGLEKGRWKIQASWTVAGESFYASKELVIGVDQ